MWTLFLRNTWTWAGGGGVEQIGNFLQYYKGWAQKGKSISSMGANEEGNLG